MDTIAKISSFVSIDSPLLERAFKIQSENVAKLQKKGNIFFNKSISGYYRHYFSEKALKKFCEFNHFAMQQMGYEELCDGILSGKSFRENEAAVA